MASMLLREQAAAFVQPRPEIRPGFTVRVHERVQEGGKERIQVFEGLVISMHRGHVPTDTTFTVRRIVSGVGVEKIFSLYSPNVTKVEIKKVAKIRRAKLFFLRGRRGKAARLSERFTTSKEFAVAAQVEEEKEEEVKSEAVESEAVEPVSAEVLSGESEKVKEAKEDNKEEDKKE